MNSGSAKWQSETVDTGLSNEPNPKAAKSKATKRSQKPLQIASSALQQAPPATARQYKKIKKNRKQLTVADGLLTGEEGKERTPSPVRSPQVAQERVILQIPTATIFLRQQMKQPQKSAETDELRLNYREKMLDLITANPPQQTQPLLPEEARKANKRPKLDPVVDSFFDPEVQRKYNVGRVLGKGSYAKVRVAFLKDSQDRFAVKTYQQAQGFNLTTENIKNEINVLKKLNHPQIIKLHEVINSQHHIHLVLQHADGQTLSAYLSAKGKEMLSESECWPIFWQLLDVVGHCHSQRIYHRDLKLSNLIITDSKEVFLIDFGFAVNAKRDGLLHTYCGTLHYLAPEVVSSTPYRGGPADVWSLGVILFRMLAGYYPFKGELISADQKRGAGRDSQFGGPLSLPLQSERRQGHQTDAQQDAFGASDRRRSELTS